MNNMNETILQDLELEASNGRKSNYFQIDFLKADFLMYLSPNVNCVM